MKRENEDIQRFVDGLDLQKRINLRDCLSGGRVEVFQSFVDVTEDDRRIFYQDVQSLYPYILRSKSYPTDHPIAIPGSTIDLAELDKYFGIIFCRVLPPRKLHLPVLPFRTEGKLLFPLCRTCAVNSYAEKCLCSDGERAWVGCYTSAELKVARERGYRVLKVFEVLHWDKSQLKVYDPTTRKGGLFTEYINTFLKLKCEASGFPSSCGDDPDAQAKYIADYYNTTGVRLEHKNIVLNPGKRALAKSLLNS